MARKRHLEEDFFNSCVVHAPKKLMSEPYVILSNRVSADLANVAEKIPSQDVC